MRRKMKGKQNLKHLFCELFGFEFDFVQTKKHYFLVGFCSTNEKYLMQIYFEYSIQVLDFKNQLKRQK